MTFRRLCAATALAAALAAPAVAGAQAVPDGTGVFLQPVDMSDIDCTTDAAAIAGDLATARIRWIVVPVGRGVRGERIRNAWADTFVPCLAAFRAAGVERVYTWTGGPQIPASAETEVRQLVEKAGLLGADGIVLDPEGQYHCAAGPARSRALVAHAETMARPKGLSIAVTSPATNQVDLAPYAALDFALPQLYDHSGHRDADNLYEHLEPWIETFGERTVTVGAVFRNRADPRAILVHELREHFPELYFPTDAMGWWSLEFLRRDRGLYTLIGERDGQILDDLCLAGTWDLDTRAFSMALSQAVSEDLGIPVPVEMLLGPRIAIKRFRDLRVDWEGASVTARVVVPGLGVVPISIIYGGANKARYNVNDAEDPDRIEIHDWNGGATARAVGHEWVSRMPPDLTPGMSLMSLQILPAIRVTKGLLVSIPERVNNVAKRLLSHYDCEGDRLETRGANDPEGFSMVFTRRSERPGE